MKKLLLVVTLLAFAQLAVTDQISSLLNEATRVSRQFFGDTSTSGAAASYGAADTTNWSGSSQILNEAYQRKLGNLQVEGSGQVTRLLPDDNDGSRHQRFIVTLDSGQTLLIAHNIDLAPRITDLKNGDTLAFYGEYEWNKDGGVMHWTHHDPQGRHMAGWLKHNGRTYQ